MYFYLAVIFSFLDIFQVLQCAFLIFLPYSIFPYSIFRDFQFSRHIPGVHFSFFTFFSDFVIFQGVKWMFLIFHDFQFPAIFHVLQWTFLNYPTFSVFLAIFHVLKCVFLIFHDFQFSCHIPCPTVDISKFSTFFSFPPHISRPKLCISI